MSARWLCVLTLLCLAFSLPVIAAEESSGPDQIHWKNGDLVPPLPRDEALRARALAEVEAAARARLAAMPGVTVLPPAQAMGPVHPSGPVRVTRTAPALDPAAAVSMSVLEAIRDRIWDIPVGTRTETAVHDPAGVAMVVPEDALEPAAGFGPQAGFDDTGLSPASPDIAIGRERVVITVNSEFQVRDRCGNIILANTFASQFSVTAGFTAYDGRVVYDEWSNRFVMIFSTLRSSPDGAAVYVCISSDGSAETWGWYAFSFAAAGRFGDDLSVAVSPQGIYLSGNEFTFGTYAYHGATIIELDKADAYAFNALTIHTRRGLTNPIDASLATSARPAQMHAFPGAVYFVSAKPEGASSYTLYTLTGAPGSSSLVSANVSSTAYARAPNVQQPNLSLVRMPDCRVADAVYDAGRVMLVLTIQHPTTPTAATIRVWEITVATVTARSAYLSIGTNCFYPSIDVDDFGRLGMFYTRVSTSEFISTGYYILSLSPSLESHASGMAMVGQANYVRGSSPYRWGNSNGIARDPLDHRTFWTHGAIASASPANSWETQLYLAGAPVMSDLDVTPPAPLFIGGVEGGPFSPTTFSFLLENTGPATANWTISILPDWLTASETSGTVAPYSTGTVRVDLDPGVTGYAPGLYNASLSIDNCSGTGGWTQMVQLAIGMDFQCPGAGMSLQPPGSVPLILGVTAPDPGVYVTAMEDVSLCAVGILAVISSPANAVVDVYEANGTTRGPLVTSGSAMLFRRGMTWQYIPVNATLEACREYEIVVSYPVPWTYDALSESHVLHPFDVGGAIRVRDASSNGGDPSTNALPPLVLIGAPGARTDQTDLVTDPDASSAGPDRGTRVEALGTRQLSSITVEMIATPGSRVFANVFELSGGTRSRLVGFGSAFCHEIDWQEIEIPVSVQMVAGKRYDVAVGIPLSAAVRVDESASLPYEAGPLMVLGGSSGGFLDPGVVDMTLNWSDDWAGLPFDLVKPGGGAASTLSGAAARGVYVTSEIDQEVYSLGVYGDVPTRATVIARIYEATGTTRGALIASGQAGSEAVGKRWHDVPLSATFLAGHNYDLEIEFVNSTAVDSWTDSGLPYTAYGTIEVLDAEQSGNPSGTQLLRYRIHACAGTATPVDDEPARTPMYLANPVPNPTSGEVRFDYGIDEEGPVEIAIYDVAGRLVGRVFSNDSASRGGAQIRYDSSRLASGVYFARLTTRTKSLSRKFVVTR